MEIEAILGTILGFLIIIAIIVIVVIKKKKAEQVRKKKLEEKYKKEDEKKKKIINLKSKIKENQITKVWINNIVNHCIKIISENPTYDLSWEILTEKQDFFFGHNFQRRYYENIRTTEYIKNPNIIFSHHFSEFGLPEFDKESEANQFAKAMAETVKEKLEEENINITIQEYQRTIVHRSDNYCWFDNCELYVIRYTRQKSTGSW